jgi:ferrous iron transport protein B
MTVAVEHKTITVALVGNPNTGKSTLFTALAGVRQRIGNYPGVTVEKKIGHFESAGKRWALVDLPGTYSLAPRSPDEMVVVDVLLNRRADAAPCDAIICIVDASNLERNLYLVSQVLELGLPTIVALNMIDIADSRGIRIDVSLLEKRLGLPVVAIQANRHRGLTDLKAALSKAIDSAVPAQQPPFPEPFRAEVCRLENELNADAGRSDNVPRYLAERLLLDTSGYLEQALGIDARGNGEVSLGQKLKFARERLGEAGCTVPAIEAIARYAWVAQILDGVCQGQQVECETLTDKIDKVLTHRFWGTLAFAVVMLALFSSIFVVARPLMNGIATVTQWIGGWVQSHMAEGALRSLLVDGIIGGVGSVIVFLPQILILFMFIAILEDCGYMARAAYLMDKLMVRVGLSGKSFIPLLSSFACAIPGIMAARVIENRRDRFTTILVAPLMSCSARLPVYTLLIAAFIPGGALLRGFTLFCMYLVGIVAAAVVALVLRKTVFRGATPPFVMELPPYKAPSPTLVLHRMVERGWAFLYRAGTLIVAVAIVVWALLYYPHDERAAQAELEQRKARLTAELEQVPADHPARAEIASEIGRYDNPDECQRMLKGALQRGSFLGRIGRFLEPAVKPLGWDWRIGSAVLASFPAREVVLGTLGVIYNLGDVDFEEEQGKLQLQTQLREAKWDGSGRPVFTLPMALGLMVFFALCAQCAATLVIIKRETNTWRWPAFTFVYMTVLAYLGALATYQLGTWLSG